MNCTSICIPLSPLLHLAFLAAFFPFLRSLLDLQTKGPNLSTRKQGTRCNIKLATHSVWKHFMYCYQLTWTSSLRLLHLLCLLGVGVEVVVEEEVTQCPVAAMSPLHQKAVHPSHLLHPHSLLCFHPSCGTLEWNSSGTSEEHFLMYSLWKVMFSCCIAVTIIIMCIKQYFLCLQVILSYLSVPLLHFTSYPDLAHTPETLSYTSSGYKLKFKWDTSWGHLTSIKIVSACFISVM